MTPTLERETALQRLRVSRQAMAARVDEIRAEIAGKGLLGRILARRRHAAALRMMTQQMAAADDLIGIMRREIVLQRSRIAGRERAVREAAR